MSTNSNSTFADRLRAAREGREMSQTELARKVGMQPSAIAHFEGGRRKPSFQNVRILADALGRTSDYLLGSDGKTTAFRNEEKLSAADREFIQGIINMRVDEKEGK